MKMVVTNDGKKYFLNSCILQPEASSEDWRVELFQNNYTPVDGSVTANFTPATFTGYALVLIAQGSINPAVIVDNVAVSLLFFPPTYTCTGGTPQTVYGWYLVGDSTDKTYLAQRFDVPRVMAPGTVEMLDPFQIKLKSFT